VPTIEMSTAVLEANEPRRTGSELDPSSFTLGLPSLTQADSH
jgi:hypothetical protein